MIAKTIELLRISTRSREKWAYVGGHYVEGKGAKKNCFPITPYLVQRIQWASGTHQRHWGEGEGERSLCDIENSSGPWNRGRNEWSTSDTDLKTGQEACIAVLMSGGCFFVFVLILGTSAPSVFWSWKYFWLLMTISFLEAAVYNPCLSQRIRGKYVQQHGLQDVIRERLSLYSLPSFMPTFWGYFFHCPEMKIQAGLVIFLAMQSL